MNFKTIGLLAQLQWIQLELNRLKEVGKKLDNQIRFSFYITNLTFNEVIAIEKAIATNKKELHALLNNLEVLGATHYSLG